VGIIAWIILGAIAGFITNLIMGGKEGVIATVILGIIGAVVGGFLAGSVLKVADVTGINIESIVVAVIRCRHRRLNLPNAYGPTHHGLTSFGGRPQFVTAGDWAGIPFVDVRRVRLEPGDQATSAGRQAAARPSP